MEETVGTSAPPQTSNTLRPWHLVIAELAQSIPKPVTTSEEGDTSTSGSGSISPHEWWEHQKKLSPLEQERVYKNLAEQLGLKFVPLASLEIDPAVLKIIPTKSIFQNDVIPLELQDNLLVVVTSFPFDPQLMSTLRWVTQKRIELRLSTPSDISDAQKRFYGVGAETLDKMIDDLDLPAAVNELEKADLSNIDSEATVVRFVNQIIREAVHDRATDIHLEPQEYELRIRYRIDGVLVSIPLPPRIKKVQDAIISRVKVMANLDIAEKRLPQDGRIGLKIGGEDIDIRVSTLPTAYGESVSLRLLTRKHQKVTLGDLGYDERDQDLIKRQIVRPHGIILVTGPTGSGKSTSLHAFLSHINSVDLRIMTIEDPIEYELPGANQTEVKEEIGLTFARGLRHLLRQDPDVIMVGEIRDLDTAEIAIRAALTGHLVFSTLHTNDSAGGFTRLVDMGIEPFLVTSSVNAIIAQRLVRKICPKCKTEHTPNMELLQRLGLTERFNITKNQPAGRANTQQEIQALLSKIALFKNAKFYHGAGCEACKRIGYQGQTGIYEVLTLTEQIRQLITNRASAQAIKQAAIANGMRTLREESINKVLGGMTTLEEVYRVTQEDEVYENEKE